MYEFETTYRVCYADIDQMGYMYYGHYARLYEIGRVEALRSLGLPYKLLEEKEGIMLPVYDNFSRFHAPAKYDDLLTIKVLIKDTPKARFVFEYEISNEKGETLNTGKTTLVFVKMDSLRVTSCPASISNKLKTYFTN